MNIAKEMHKLAENHQRPMNSSHPIDKVNNDIPGSKTTSHELIRARSLDDLYGQLDAKLKFED